MNKIAIFADIQNIYYTTRSAFGRQFNYRAFWERVSRQGDIVLANAYAIQRFNNDQQKFQHALRNIGFDIKLKPYIQRSDGSAKGDWDVGITVDILRNASQVNTVILLSGDGDFDLLLENVARIEGINTEVYGVSTLTAQSLIDAAGTYHPIDQGLLI